jgi:hypothetical protein
MHGHEDYLLLYGEIIIADKHLVSKLYIIAQTFSVPCCGITYLSSILDIA